VSADWRHFELSKAVFVDDMTQHNNQWEMSWMDLDWIVDTGWIVGLEKKGNEWTAFIM
jgi:hypothetical protein